MKRIPEFDALRGLAAAIIVVYHLRFLKVAPAMGTAVDLFFVLSGYLITGILLRDLGVPGSIRRFYVRRALRIWPIYYLALAVLLVLNHVSVRPHPIDAWPQFLTYTPFVQAYWGGSMPTFPPAFVHTWSLAVEEQFYTLWPLLVVAFGRRVVAAIPPLLVLGVVLRFRGIPGGLLLTHLDGLLLGSWLAVALEPRGDARAPRPNARRGAGVAIGALVFWAIGKGAVALAMAGDLERIVAALGPMRIAVGYAGLVSWVIAFEGRPMLAVLRDHRLIELGNISYGFYLYHPIVFAAITNLWIASGLKGSIPNASLWLDALRLGLSFGAAWASWRWIEAPIGRWKDRLTSRRPGSIAGRPHFAHRALDASAAAERVGGGG